ncbi:hypothetical protein N7499_004231 [Penicillium canescens]|uniref:GPI anchored protein n=1 Tax=Penicillium canescens TaxID=5083 RepID=A0AAD6IAV0_PENCN|nr:uncharacterized protein N7446_005100 [Penicillium canescens]KAJ6038286.1 hypothetical protein N7460_008057 [Penicillium canescens]KAJ6039593.1 hypothetical protein N7444_008498 [Penicillium canescens]KAJ6068063.1 hypothetical protein N7446_005100 [Penicillium canescens]KAJ6088049.1 hypothetical protein N7499_004231 [Penicillium canescens]KAJ6181448.1 hypothetical protein N7485_000090 [Penicillium canescens]
MNYITKKVGLLLLLPSIAASNTLKNEARLQYNETLNSAKPGILSTRDLFGLTSRDYYECDPDYSECAYDTSRCCPTGSGCCGDGYCAEADEICCSSGTCPSGWDCCGNGNCSPKDGECCSDGQYCLSGYSCMIYDGEKVCCPESGCVGNYDSVELGSTTTAIMGVTTTMPVTTPVPITETYYYYSYYYTTYYWTYWWYFWTSYYPYAVKTVTSTETTTGTVYSAYATDSAEAISSLEYSISVYSFTPPATATSLKSSTDPVPISSIAGATATSGSSSANKGGRILGIGPASVVSASGNVALTCVIAAGVIGVLVFGL